MRKLAFVLFAVAGFGLALSAAHPESGSDDHKVAATQPQAAAYWSGVVRISVDPRVIPADINTLSTLVASMEIAGPCIREALGPSRDASAVGIRLSSTASQKRGSSAAAIATQPDDAALVAELSIELVDGSEDQARRIFNGVVARLRTALATATQQTRKRLEERSAAADEAVEREKMSLTPLRRAMQDIRAGNGAVERMRADLQTVETELARLQMERAGRHARQTALMEQIATLQAQTEQRVTEDEAVRALQKVVELRRNAIDRINKLYRESGASEAELRQAETEHAMAQAELVRQRQQAAQQAGGAQIAHLRDMLADVAIELPDLEARIHFAEPRLKLLREQILRAEDISLQLRRSERAFELAEARREEAMAAMRALPDPDVSIIGRAAPAEQPAKP